MDYGLNLETLGALRQLEEPGKSGFLDEIIEAYILDTATRLQAVRDAHKAGDFKAISALAHAIKGASLNLGADGLAALMQAMEQDANRGVACDPARLQDIDSHFVGVSGALRAYRL